MRRRPISFGIALACTVALLAGCSTDDGQVEGNTQLNVVIPNGTGNGSSAPAAAQIGVVEYTIQCDDAIDAGPFLENGATLDNDVTINGVLEVLNADAGASIGADFGPDLTEVFVWQGFMDLPPTAGCTVQLRARDADGEVICTATQAFDITADATTKVNVLMQCDVSFQAPVGMLDLDADFQFNVSNFCPNLYVLNCVDSFPQVPLPGVPPTTYCETRFQDDDGQCGASCDPQTCVDNGAGLTCTPGADNGVSTTVTCDANGLIDCEGDFNFDGSCTWNGAATGTTGAGVPVPVLLGGPGPEAGGFFVACNPAAPGSDVTCTAVTTDGDTDCDKTKTVTFTCPSVHFCDDPRADCDDGNECTTDTCDRVAAACVNDNVPAGGGNNCTSAGGAPGECDGAGVCTPFGCVEDDVCDNPNTECLVAPFGACDLGTGICSPEVPGNEGARCDSGVSFGVGVCVGGSCVPQVEDCVGDDACENPNTECLVAPAGACDVATGLCAFEIPGNDGASCDSGSGSGAGVCGGGSCVSLDACIAPWDCPGATDCVAATCSGTPSSCGTQNRPLGTTCNQGAGQCDGAGVCGPLRCTQDSDCEDPSTACLVAPGAACNFSTGVCAPEIPGNDGVSCSTGSGSNLGICGGGTCVTLDECNVAADCPDDGNECTDNRCSGSPRVCGDDNSAAGTPCAFPPNLCDGAGTCGLPPDIGVGVGQTVWAAIPTTATGCTYDPVATACTGCTVTGPPVPGGGQCGQFGTQVVGGCEVPGGVLNAQLAIDVTITLDIVSDGAGNILHGITIRAENPALSTAAGLVNVLGLEVLSVVTSGIPSTLVNALDPAFANTVLGAFTGGSNVLLLDNDPATGLGVEIPTVVTAVTPTSSPSVNFNFSGDFLLELIVNASGTSLNVSGGACLYDAPGDGVQVPVN